METCQIEGCRDAVFVKSRGWCKRHYTRWWRTGDPLDAKYDRASGTPLQRWWSKVKQTETCWLWTGSLDKKGYGQFDVVVNGKHKNHRAHRWGFEQLVGPIAEGLEPDHLCRVHACVRPDHLEVVTHAENVARGLAGNWNAIKTHCKNGHEFTEENTRHYGPDNRWRECRTCAGRRMAGKMRRYRARKKAAAKG